MDDGRLLNNDFLEILLNGILPIKDIVLNTEYIHKLRETGYTEIILNVWAYVFFWEMAYTFHCIFERLFFF